MTRLYKREMECRCDFSTMIDVLRLWCYTRYNVISMIDDDVVGLGWGWGWRCRFVQRTVPSLCVEK